MGKRPTTCRSTSQMADLCSRSTHIPSTSELKPTQNSNSSQPPKTFLHCLFPILPRSTQPPISPTHLSKSNLYHPIMDLAQIHKKEFITIAVALAAVGVGTAYYFYINRKPKGCLDSENYVEFKLVKRTQLSHNVASFKFELPKPTSVLGLPIGQHISCRGKDAVGDEVVKAYTPTTLDTDVGYFELVIKMYPQGRMSHHFREMKEGDYLAVKGPKGRFKYEPGQVRAFGMLAGGTGITPMYQVARAILENPKDKTKICLIYANVSAEDILLKEELDNLARSYPDQFSVYYVLNQPPEEWSGGVGFVSQEMIQAHCPAPSPDIKVLRCGPPPMNKAMSAHLKALGYTPEMQFQF